MSAVEGPVAEAPHRDDPHRDDPHRDDPHRDRPRRDSPEARLAFIVEGQHHADWALTPLADPRDRRVLVVGCGAGTEMLWALRHGAREVVGIDILDQDPSALTTACERLEAGTLDLEEPPRRRLEREARDGAEDDDRDDDGKNGDGDGDGDGDGNDRPPLAERFAFHRLPAEEAHRLGRRFDLVLSNNVFEHVGDPVAAMVACARSVVPGSGRVAIFTDPLFYSSIGAHLPAEPWEHLWGEGEALRQRLLESGVLGDHSLEVLPFERWMDEEISLNRLRLGRFLEAVEASGLALLNLRLHPDRHLGRLPKFRERIRERHPEASALDLGLEGLGAELVLPPQDNATPPTDPEIRPAEAQLLEAERRRFGHERFRRRAAETRVAELEALLDRVETSPSFRLGRALTAPVRWVRGILSGSRGG